MKRALIIDEHCTFLNNNMKYFKELLPDFEIQSETDFDKAYDVLKRDKPIFCFINSDNKAEKTVRITEKIRSERTINDVFVIIIHNEKCSVTERMRYMDAGAEVFIKVPVDPQDLYSKICLLLRLRKAESGVHEHEICMKRLLELQKGK